MTKKWFLTLLIILMVIIAGCGNRGLENKEPEHIGSYTEEKVNTEEISAAPEINSRSNEDPPANNGLAGETKVTDNSSSGTLPTIADNSADQVKLLITREFGQQVILEETIKIEENWTIMDLLAAKTKLETRYGGGFIDSINGLKSTSGGLSGEMHDWFYYVNGICPDVGGLDYLLNPGEVIWWDYHAWKAGPANAAVIGCYPEPFLHGYAGKIKSTAIMCPTDDLAAGNQLEKALKAKGVSNIRVIPVDEQLLANREGPTIVLGEWEQLNQISFLKDLNQAYKRNGMGIHFNEMKLELMDIQGKVSRSLGGSAGVIAAAGSGLGDPCPLWLVSGTDLQGFQQALDLLINCPGKITGRYNAAITAGEVISLPDN